MAGTKVDSAGRFGPRYGTKIRKLVLGIERKLKQSYECPSCSSPRLKRISTSIWQCKRCNAKFAGAAYSPPSSVIRSEVQRVKEEG